MTPNHALQATRNTPSVLRFRRRQGYGGQVGFLFCHVAVPACLSSGR